MHIIDLLPISATQYLENARLQLNCQFHSRTCISFSKVTRHCLNILYITFFRFAQFLFSKYCNCLGYRYCHLFKGFYYFHVCFIWYSIFYRNYISTERFDILCWFVTQFVLFCPYSRSGASAGPPLTRCPRNTHSTVSFTLFWPIDHQIFFVRPDRLLLESFTHST